MDLSCAFDWRGREYRSYSGEARIRIRNGRVELHRCVVEAQLGVIERAGIVEAQAR